MNMRLAFNPVVAGAPSGTPRPIAHRAAAAQRVGTGADHSFQSSPASGEALGQPGRALGHQHNF